MSHRLWVQNPRPPASESTSCSSDSEVPGSVYVLGPSPLVHSVPDPLVKTRFLGVCLTCPLHGSVPVCCYVHGPVSVCSSGGGFRVRFRTRTRVCSWRSRCCVCVTCSLHGSIPGLLLRTRSRVRLEFRLLFPDPFMHSVRVRLGTRYRVRSCDHVVSVCFRVPVGSPRVVTGLLCGRVSRFLGSVFTTSYRDSATDWLPDHRLLWVHGRSHLVPGIITWLDGDGLLNTVPFQSCF